MEFPQLLSIIGEGVYLLGAVCCPSRTFFAGPLEVSAVPFDSMPPSRFVQLETTNQYHRNAIPL